MDGAAIVVKTLGGPPASRTAWSMSSTMRSEQARAPGCGAKMVALPPASIPMPLLMTVSVGLVDGVTERMTP